MPSSSAKQHRFMQAVAHSPSFAKKAGVSQSVGKDFSAADKGKTFSKGGTMKKGKRFEEGGDIEYDSDKTYSGRFTDDDTGALAENTPTRAYKPEKRETEDTSSRATSTSARAPAPAPVPAAPSRATSTSARAPAPAPVPAAPSRTAPARLPSYTEEEQARRDELEMEGIRWQAKLDQDAKKSSEAKKPEPLSNGAMAAIGAGATAAGVAVAARLAGKKAGFIEKVIEKFTSKGSKTPEPQVFRSNRLSVVPAERSKARGGRIVRMASGGSVSAASSRADGIAQRGKTKFRIY